MANIEGWEYFPIYLILNMAHSTNFSLSVYGGRISDGEEFPLLEGVIGIFSPSACAAVFVGNGGFTRRYAWSGKPFAEISSLVDSFSGSHVNA